jgi:alpha-tubulin suppressor-like RCC1 family protein
LRAMEPVRGTHPPVVVRTSPPSGGRDIPLNAVVVLVFSEPLDSATADTGSVQLWQGTTRVSGTVRFADAAHLRAEFHPDSLLAPQTDYQVVITTAIEDVNGLALDSAVTVPFTTLASTPAMPALRMISAGGFHTCALTAAGAAYCWGLDWQGELGHPASIVQDQPLPADSTPVAVADGPWFASVSAGHYHTCALTAYGAAYCWGFTFTGFIGADGPYFAPVFAPHAVPGGLTFTSLSASDGGQLAHTCGLTPSGAAYCWGDNDQGYLGDGTTTSRDTPVAVVGGLTFRALSAAGDATCGLTVAGAAYCWGYNGSGDVGDGTTIDRSTPVPVVGGLTFTSLSGSCALTPAGAAYCWGYNADGELGDGTTTNRSAPVAVVGGLTFASLTASFEHVCALTTDGTAYCWGRNEAGQLGDGTTTNRSAPVLVAGGLTFTSLSAGYAHTCGLTAGGTAYCWGTNGYGQLGDGTATSRNVPVKVAGLP